MASWAMADRCRLCTANDPDGVVEHLAEEPWESRWRGSLDDVPWAEAGGYWQRLMRELVETAVAALR